MKANIFSGLSQDLLNERKKSSFPHFIPPMLATLTTKYFSSNDWCYEHKFDGERCFAFKHNGQVKLLSRNDKSMNASYPELVKALEKQSTDNFVIDGEIIAVGKKGISDFEMLQGRMHVLKNVGVKEREVPITYCIFDIMYVDGYDVRHLPLLARKKILKKLLRYNKMLVFTEHKVGNGLKLYEKACKMGWEGLIAKRLDSTYVGFRSKDWLKFKCSTGQELVIGGFTEPQGSRFNFGALLVGYYEKGKLKYAGKVGTGYTYDVLEALGKKLKRLEIKRCPFDNYDESYLRVHWVRPVLVAEFEFAQWTKGGKLRVGRYKGLRNDKKAKDVVKEVPK